MTPLFRHNQRKKGRPIDTRASAEVVFISGGIKAALNTSPAIREKIVKDVSEVLNCTPTDLEFMFADTTTANEDNHIYDFPDSERRRRIIRENHLDAAE